MKQAKIKICGLTRIEDVEAVVDAGVDAIGFVFTPSPRRISVQRAVQLSRYIPGGILRVGLFLNQPATEIEAVLNELALDILQFHGSETEQHCVSFAMPYLKAVAMVNERSAKQAEHDYPSAIGLLLDSHGTDKAGGSGKVFDWTLARPSSRHVWLAGGLNADNVGVAIRTVKPYAVDVSSGVETSPGIKDPAKINAFVLAVKNAVGQPDGQMHNH